MKSCCGTCEQLIEALETAIAQMTEREKAQLRIQLRASYGLEPQPEPGLWTN